MSRQGHVSVRSQMLMQCFHFRADLPLNVRFQQRPTSLRQEPQVVHSPLMAAVPISLAGQARLE